MDELDEQLQIVDDGRNAFTQATGDPTLLAAKGSFQGSFDDQKKAQSNHVFKLSNTINTVFQKHGMAKIRAVGSKALSNAVKAIERASFISAKNGKEMYWKVKKEVGNLGDLKSQSHVSDVGAYVFELFNGEKK